MGTSNFMDLLNAGKEAGVKASTEPKEKEETPTQTNNNPHPIGSQQWFMWEHTHAQTTPTQTIKPPTPDPVAPVVKPPTIPQPSTPPPTPSVPTPTTQTPSPTAPIPIPKSQPTYSDEPIGAPRYYVSPDDMKHTYGSKISESYMQSKVGSDWIEISGSENKRLSRIPFVDRYESAKPISQEKPPPPPQIYPEIKNEYYMAPSQGYLASYGVAPEKSKILTEQEYTTLKGTVGETREDFYRTGKLPQAEQEVKVQTVTKATDPQTAKLIEVARLEAQMQDAHPEARAIMQEHKERLLSEVNITTSKKITIEYEGKYYTTNYNSTQTKALKKKYEKIDEEKDAQKIIDQEIGLQERKEDLAIIEQKNQVEKQLKGDPSKILTETVPKTLIEKQIFAQKQREEIYRAGMSATLKTIDIYADKTTKFLFPLSKEGSFFSKAASTVIGGIASIPVTLGGELAMASEKAVITVGALIDPSTRGEVGGESKRAGTEAVKTISGYDLKTKEFDMTPELAATWTTAAIFAAVPTVLKTATKPKATSIKTKSPQAKISSSKSTMQVVKPSTSKTVAKTTPKAVEPIKSTTVVKAKTTPKAEPKGTFKGTTEMGEPIIEVASKTKIIKYPDKGEAVTIPEIAYKVGERTYEATGVGIERVTDIKLKGKPDAIVTEGKLAFGIREVKYTTKKGVTTKKYGDIIQGGQESITIINPKGEGMESTTFSSTKTTKTKTPVRTETKAKSELHPDSSGMMNPEFPTYKNISATREAITKKPMTIDVGFTKKLTEGIKKESIVKYEKGKTIIEEKQIPIQEWETRSKGMGGEYLREVKQVNKPLKAPKKIKPKDYPPTIGDQMIKSVESQLSKIQDVKTTSGSLKTVSGKPPSPQARLIEPTVKQFEYLRMSKEVLDLPSPLDNVSKGASKFEYVKKTQKVKDKPFDYLRMEKEFLEKPSSLDTVKKVVDDPRYLLKTKTGKKINVYEKPPSPKAEVIRPKPKDNSFKYLEIKKEVLDKPSPLDNVSKEATKFKYIKKPQKVKDKPFDYLKLEKETVEKPSKLDKVSKEVTKFKYEEKPVKDTEKPFSWLKLENKKESVKVSLKEPVKTKQPTKPKPIIKEKVELIPQEQKIVPISILKPKQQTKPKTIIKTSTKPILIDQIKPTTKPKTEVKPKTKPKTDTKITSSILTIPDTITKTKPTTRTTPKTTPTTRTTTITTPRTITDITTIPDTDQIPDITTIPDTGFPPQTNPIIVPEPPPPIVPIIPPFIPFPYGDDGKKAKKGPTIFGRAYKYTPSVLAIALGIREKKKPKKGRIYTPFEIRPMLH